MYGFGKCQSIYCSIVLFFTLVLMKCGKVFIFLLIFHDGNHHRYAGAYVNFLNQNTKYHKPMMMYERDVPIMMC